MPTHSMRAIHIHSYGRPDQLKKEQEQVQAHGVRAMTSRGATHVSLETLIGLADEGYLKVPVGKTLPLSEVQQAHAYAQSGQGRGRFVLRVVEENHVVS